LEYGEEDNILEQMSDPKVKKSQSLE